MPTVEISKKDLEKLVGKKFSKQELEEYLLVVKGEIELIEGDNIKIDIKDINRPDLWSTTGIARELRGELGKERGLPDFKVKSSQYKVIVDDNLKGIRPLTVCAVLKNLKLDDAGIKQLIDLQEKLSENFGRQRKEAALGIYDADKIAWPIYYKAADPDKTKFIPLEMDKEITLRQILGKHEKGRKYGHLLQGKKKYPIFIDAKKKILSMPPIINSNESGKITEKTKNAFIEVSGFSFRFIVPCLLVMVAELAERGAKIESVSVHYKNKKITMPDYKPGKIEVDVDYCNKVLGMKLNAHEIKRLLEKRRHDAQVNHNRIQVKYPAYRQDILHERDIIEDIAISYGYNKIKPVIPRLATFGKQSKESEMQEKVASLLVGLDMQEVATFNLTNKDEQFKKMNLKEMPVVEIKNPVSNLYSLLREWITPSLLAFLEKNKKARYPQKIFEIGTCVKVKEKGKEKHAEDITRVAIAITHKNANYTEARQILDYLLRNLGFKYKIQECEHPSFIAGRVARVFVRLHGKEKDIAYIGEIHPKVLKAFGLNMPVSVFELNLSELLVLA
ncbi:phenylalanine--tRNA ligase subunit beta [Candidatus Pacearchaeota archaeon ex4484_26]|nr:MAG: phenylalanine--tRNA ligase subunit beta [Candidatus Pacearchaeota archaeon ex4484_26]